MGTCRNCKKETGKRSRKKLRIDLEKGTTLDHTGKGFSTGSGTLELDLDEAGSFQIYNFDHTVRVTGGWDVDGNVQVFVFTRTPTAIASADKLVEDETDDDGEGPTEPVEGEEEGTGKLEGAIATGPGYVQDIMDAAHIPIKIKAKTQPNGSFPSSDESGEE